MKTLLEKEQKGLPQEMKEALEKVEKMDCELIGKLVLEGLESTYGRQGTIVGSLAGKLRGAALEVEKFICEKRDVRKLMTINIVNKDIADIGLCGYLEVHVMLKGMEDPKYGVAQTPRTWGGQRPIDDFLSHCAEAVMSGKTRYIVDPYYTRQPDEKELLICKVLREACKQNKLDKENFNPDRGINKSAEEILVESAGQQTKPTRKTPEFADMTKEEQEEYIKKIQSVLLPANPTVFWNLR